MISRHPVRLTPDPRRVLLRPFLQIDPNRVATMVGRVAALDESAVEALLADIRTEFGDRHRNLEQAFENHFEAMRPLMMKGELTRARRLLLGSYFTMEYAFESSALFNPSIVPHPDQENVPRGGIRFIMSLRATGEGHISSIEFRSGVLTDRYNLDLDPPGRYACTPTHEPKPAESNYTTCFPEAIPLNERVIFPVSINESNGMEDARFVRFQEDDGTFRWYATYTAYDGRKILSSFIETADFLTFHVHTLHGRAVQNKGMALFPRKIGGKYAMIGRQDNESISIMFSSHLHFWEDAQTLIQPKYPWESVQLGNCGSPLETEAGWLLLTHGVGPVRKYCIGAALLDRDDPTRVIGRLAEPLLAPTAAEREGYVPNVLYTCGALVHNGFLFIPYAMSDTATGLATVSFDDLLERLLASGSSGNTKTPDVKHVRRRLIEGDPDESGSPIKTL